MSHGADADAVLADLPASLWLPLLRAVRRALDTYPDPPAALRPYARWHPERLATADRPRSLVARALLDDAALRAAAGEALDPASGKGPYADAEAADVERLRRDHGPDVAAAALVCRARWDDLAVLAAQEGARLAARDRAATEASLQRELAGAEGARRRLADELTGVRDERDAQRRRADQAEQRLRAEARERRRAEDRIGELEAELAGVRDRLAQERRRAADRQARLRRRAEEAEAQLRIDGGRARRVAESMEAMAAELRAALAGPSERGAAAASGDGAEPPEGGDGAGCGPPGSTAVPRDVPPATAGRPCRLPAGVVRGEPAEVRSLLRVPGVTVLVDAYNVTKDDRGVGTARLEDQRRWLLAHLGGVVARHDCQVTAVFDGTEPVGTTLRSPRGVRVVFSQGEEIADDRIGTLLRLVPPDAPVVVVSSDREVQAAARQAGADVVASGTFLQATRA